MEDPNRNSATDEPVPTERPSSRWESRATDIVTVGLALWTISCHLTVIAGGSLLQVIWIVSVFIAGSVFLGLTGRVRPFADEAINPETTSFSGPAETGDPLWLGVTIILAAGVGTMAASLSGNLPLLWWWIATILVFGLFWVSSRTVPMARPARTDRRSTVLLVALALTSAIITLIMHRWDADDVFYVSLAVSAADFPHAAIMKHDVMHGISGLPLHMPLYWVQSWELLMGAISYITGIPSIACFHWLAACGAAILMPLAWARLFKTLLPSRWLWATVTVMIVLLAAGDAPRWYGSFGLARIWQGKAFFVSVLVPLVAAYGLEFGSRPSQRRGFMVATAVIASVGATVNALWIAPVVAAVSIASATTHLKHLTAAAKGVIVASAYPLIVAILVKQEAAALVNKPHIVPTIETWTSSLESFFGSQALLGVALVAIAAVWSTGLAEPARRFAVLSTAVAWLTILNPYLIDVVTKHIVGPFYWRAMWAIPIPILLGIFLTWPAADRILGPMAGRVASVVLTAVFILMVPHTSQFTAETGTAIHLPSLKVPPVEYHWAQILNNAVPAGSHVVAPRTIGNLLPIMHGHAFPLEARRYLEGQPAFVDEGELALRRMMISTAEGRGITPYSLRKFRSGLGRFRISGVCFRLTGRDQDLRNSLASSGFVAVQTNSDYEVWVQESIRTDDGRIGRRSTGGIHDE